MDPHLPTTAIGLAGLIVVTLAGLIKFGWEQRGQTKTLTGIHEQTHNKHETNLRDDLDDVIKDLREGLDMLRDIQTRMFALEGAMSGMRFELHEERDRAISADKQLSVELAAERERAIVADNDLRRHIETVHGRLDSDK